MYITETSAKIYKTKEDMVLKEKESQIQRAVLEYLSYRPGFWFRSNTGAVAAEYRGKKRFIRFGVKGAADIFGIIPPEGRFVAIEVKRPGGGKQTDEQKQFQEKVEKNGGLYFLVYGVQDLIERHL